MNVKYFDRCSNPLTKSPAHWNLHHRHCQIHVLFCQDNENRPLKHKTGIRESGCNCKYYIKHILLYIYSRKARLFGKGYRMVLYVLFDFSDFRPVFIAEQYNISNIKQSFSRRKKYQFKSYKKLIYSSSFEYVQLITIEVTYVETNLRL